MRVATVTTCRRRRGARDGATRGRGSSDAPRPAFIRFFGCSADEVCQVLPAPNDALSSSVFTKAFVDAITVDKVGSLNEVLARAQARSNELVAGYPYLKAQTPRLSFGEQSAEKLSILDRPIFDPVGAAAFPSAWNGFEPSKFHCLVVSSEHKQ